MNSQFNTYEYSFPSLKMGYCFPDIFSIIIFHSIIQDTVTKKTKKVITQAERKKKNTADLPVNKLERKMPKCAMTLSFHILISLWIKAVNITEIFEIFIVPLTLSHLLYIGIVCVVLHPTKQR